MYGNELGEAIASRRKLGVIIFGSANEVAHCSGVARSQLAELGISLSDGRSLLGSGDSHQLILDAIAQCFLEKRCCESWVILGTSAMNSSVMSISYSDKHAESDEEGVVVGLIRSPGEIEWAHDGPRIMKAFGLTQREAQLSLHLSQGKILGDFAAQHFLTVNTVKTHLKQLFKKMGVNKQIQVAVVVWAALR